MSNSHSGRNKLSSRSRGVKLKSEHFLGPVLKVVCLGYKHVLRLQYTDVTVPTYCVQKIVLKSPITQHRSGVKIPSTCMAAEVNKINTDTHVSSAQKQQQRPSQEL
jgi:hypothetical protein